MSIYRRCILSVLSAVLIEVAVSNSEVFAQTFPSRSIRLVVPFAAGGSTDVVARIVAAEMSKVLGQQVVVDNKPGGGGSIGSAEVAKSAPDGYTILAATVSTHAINPSLYTKLAFDAAKEFQPLVHLVNVPNVLVVHPSVPVKIVSDLRDYAKANPDKLNYASPGNGSIGHLQAHWFGRLINAEMTHIPYRGAGPALRDLVAGQVHLMVDNVPTSLEHIRAGAIRAIVVSSETRIPQLPDTPSSPEAGIPNFIGYSWVALLMPKGTRRLVVDTLSQAAVKALENPQVRERLTELSATVVADGPETTAAFLEKERAKWAPIVKASGVTLD
jgi:tripartite-type tricarboxylate transporter receptor subunit TctC